MLEEHSGAWSRSHWLSGALDGALGFTMHCDPALGECAYPPTIMPAAAIDLDSMPQRSFATLRGHRNDVHAVVDSTGDVVDRYAHDMNGDTIWQHSEGIGHWESKDLEERCWAGSEDPGCRSHYGNMRRFTGARWDPSSATYYLRARTYSPHLALFKSRDPLGDVDSYDVWMYVGGNPFGFVDPWGMGAEEGATGPPPRWPRAEDPVEVWVGQYPFAFIANRSAVKLVFRPGDPDEVVVIVSGTLVGSNELGMQGGVTNSYAQTSPSPNDEQIDNWTFAGATTGETATEALTLVNSIDPQGPPDADVQTYHPFAIGGYNCNGFAQGVLNVLNIRVPVPPDGPVGSGYSQTAVFQVDWQPGWQPGANSPPPGFEPVPRAGD